MKLQKHARARAKLKYNVTWNTASNTNYSDNLFSKLICIYELLVCLYGLILDNLVEIFSICECLAYKFNGYFENFAVIWMMKVNF